jgi:hypothetical protein
MKIFASLGDVEGVDVATVAFNSKQLSITPDVLVHGSINRTLQLLAEEPSKQMLGPFEATMANTRTTKSRTMAYIPFEMMELVLDSQLTARQAYELIVPVLVDTHPGPGAAQRGHHFSIPPVTSSWDGGIYARTGGGQPPLQAYPVP